MTETITAYKAFDEGMTCRGFRYEVGQTYTHEGKVALCSSGFHACAVPFDCWNYYPHSLELARVSIDVANRDSEGSKVVGASITIEAKLSLPEWIQAQAEAVVALCKTAKKALASKREQAATNTGYRGHAAATGYSGHAAATGYRGHAAATGYSGHAAATGDRGHAAVEGENAIAANLGSEGTAQAGEGGWIVLAAYDDDYNLVAVKSAKVGTGIKPNTRYRLDCDGNFVEA